MMIDDEKGTIRISGIWFDASFDSEDMFNIRYNNQYFNDLVYFIKENKYILETTKQSLVNSYLDYLDGYPVNEIAPNNIEITKNDFKNLSLREKVEESINLTKFSDLKYYQPFK